MNQENFEFLKERLFFLGFGENLNADLKKKMEAKEDKFTLQFPGEFGSESKKEVVNYVLDFSKSKMEGKPDRYYLNNYTANMAQDDPENVRSQKFYLNNGSGVTAKEAYNLLNGRAVYKNNLVNKNDEKYEAWIQLDFREQDKHGNNKLQQYHKAWNFDLEKSLKRHPIKDLEHPVQKDQLIASLRKGNVQQTTFSIEGQPTKMYLEANPRERNVIVYDESLQKKFQGIKKADSLDKSNGHEVNQDVGGRGTTENTKAQSAQAADTNGQPVSQEKKGRQETQKNAPDNEPPKRTRKKGMSV